MNILVISSNYPSRTFPNYGAFVYNLMQELANYNSITIIAPFIIHRVFKKKQNSYGEEKCRVKRPLHFSFSNKMIGDFNTGKLSAYCNKKAVNRSLRTLSQKPDIVYTHFISNAIPILDYVKSKKLPLVVASGESTYGFWDRLSENIKSDLLDNISHFICVSNENKEQLIELGFDESIMTVVPNAVNYSLFKPLDKNKCKNKLGISENKFTVGFIGHFIHRKGPNRIIEAIEKLKDDDINLVCVGSKGSLKPNGFTKEIAPVPSYQLPEIFNAFDVFVLPTLYEGSCNVIEEAKACGIPIISSKGTSVEEQIDGSIGVLVDPLNIDEIADAIHMLKSDENIRMKMIDNLLKRRDENSIQERAKKINNVLIEALK